ncbi:MAG: energy transducer TonB [Proteobacteria bacterium]|nr:MAG: energy transducer TonB [Pseudomonadota bacterium]
MKGTASGLNAARGRALIMASVCLVHVLAIAAVLQTSASDLTAKPSSVIRASMLPGMPAMSPNPEDVPKEKPKPVKPKTPKPKTAQTIAAVAKEDAAPTAMQAPAPEPEKEVEDEGGGAAGNEGQGESITEATSNYLSNPAPRYPPMSRRLGEEGKILFKVFVDTEGKVKDITIQQTSGFKRLDEAALEAIRGWTFTPARKGEEKVAAWVIIPFVWSLKG